MDLKLLQGNDPKYSLDKLKVDDKSKLKGLTIGFLGSSITYGAMSLGVSFVDYLAKIEGIKTIKEAISGTTLVDDKDDSYISRLKRIDKNIRFDFFIVQLSTNDMWQNKPLGNLDDTSTHTICGAINFIIKYIRNTYKVSPIFYTNPKFNNHGYQKMVEVLLKIAQKETILVIDMYNDRKFSKITKEEHSLYMADDIHPTMAGYLLWWTPYFIKYLEKLI